MYYMSYETYLCAYDVKFSAVPPNYYTYVYEYLSFDINLNKL